MISSGKRTEWGAIRSCLITNMITDRVERHEVLLPINHNFNKICDIVGSFLNQNTASSEKKKTFKRERDGAYCPIKRYN